MTARLVRDKGLSVSRFARWLEGHPSMPQLAPRGRLIIQAALRALDPLASPAVQIPDDILRAIAMQVNRTSGADEDRGSPSPVDPAVHELKQLLDDLWFEPLRLDAFARAHAVSRFALSRRFKALMGRSPRQYLQETRIAQAKRKLVETRWPVTDIAYECGFADAAQFARLFKQTTGMTPSHYREMLG
jgi:AraC-like DNA-binding protein